jgi:hypothetical protein
VLELEIVLIFHPMGHNPTIFAIISAIISANQWWGGREAQVRRLPHAMN